MSFPKRGDRVLLKVMIPRDLDDYLRRRARPNGPDSYCPEHKGKNATVVQALQLMRELDEGVASPASEQLLSDALEALNVPRPRR